MNTTKDLPNTHRRSTAETAMNPIGQTFPVIHIHLGGNFEQPPQLLNVGTFETFSDMRSDHLLFSTETNIQIPTVNNASHIVAETFHDYGMHHLTCELKKNQKTFFVPYRLSVCRKYFANDVYDSLSHPTLSISHYRKILPIISTHVRQRLRRDTLLLNISRVHGGTRLDLRTSNIPGTDFRYSTVDQLISKTIILYVSVITVPRNMTYHFNLRIT